MGHQGIFLQNSPQDIHKKWLRKIVEHTGKYPNVIYQIGNETFDCWGQGSSGAWELGVADTVRGALGANRRLISTNSHNGAVEASSAIDYVNMHIEKAPERGALNKPVAVNEYDTSKFSYKNYGSMLRSSYNNKTYFHAWRGEWTRPKWEAVLREIRALQDEIGQ